MKVAVLSALNSPFLGPIIASIRDKGICPEFVVSDSNSLSEGALERIQSRVGSDYQSVDFYCLRPPIPVFLSKKIDSNEVLEFIRSMRIDYLVNAGVNCILKGGILNATQGVISCHPGLIPEYRGCCNVEWAILNDDPVGNTVFLMTEEIDRGPILSQQAMEFTLEDDYRSVRSKVYDAGFELLASAVFDLSDGKLDPNSLQRPDEGRYYGVIPDEKLILVQKKLRAGAYKFQV